MNIIIALVLTGAILIFLETILPGMVAGIIGFLCLVAAVFLGYRNFDIPTGTLLLGGIFVGLVIAALFWLKFFPGSRIAKVFISQPSGGERGRANPDLLDRTGVAISQLRPSGAAYINGKRVDVVTEGTLIDQGASIRVVALEGIRVVVREI
jgi:membrane-bound ClpP family serine protease